MFQERKTSALDDKFTLECDSGDAGDESLEQDRSCICMGRQIWACSQQLANVKTQR